MPSMTLWLQTTLIATAAAQSFVENSAWSSTSQRGGATHWPDKDQNRYDADYIIIGGGPSGLVLAEQLSQDPTVKVIILEAGPNNADDPRVYTPAYETLNLNTSNVFNFTTQPDAGLGDLRKPMQQGRGWGGGTAVNYMAYTRSAPSIYNEWSRLSGIQGLEWKSLLQDFEATTHYTQAPIDYDTHINASVYGNGPLEITAPTDQEGYFLQFAGALQEVLGLSAVDLTDGTDLGVSNMPETIRSSNRTRDYALPAYGYQMANRTNVRMIDQAFASHIGFAGKRACNVTYHSSIDNSVQTLKAKEIIVSAGALNSPKLLMLSGVGPKAHLEELGITVVKDMPDIGANLYDHHLAYVEYEASHAADTAWQYTENATGQALAEAQYAKNGSGPLGNNGGGPFAIYRAPDHVFEAVNDTYHPSLPADRGQLLLQSGNYNALPNLPNVPIVSSFVALVQPQASGSLRLNSSDFRHDPLIQANYFGSPGDRAAILHGYKKLREVMAHQQLRGSLVREVFPGAHVTSDEDLWISIRESSTTFYHPVGTVPLGRVLDAQWRIRGLEGIRVVDSSTFPTIPTCHLQASVYAYARLAGRVIGEADREGRCRWVHDGEHREDWRGGWGCH